MVGQTFLSVVVNILAGGTVPGKNARSDRQECLSHRSRRLLMSQSPIRLKGMTWNHSRGYTPMVATAQRFCEMQAESKVEIVWEKRSLQEFADQPIDALAKRYDLLVIDHPWAGFAAASGVLVPLDEHLPAEFLADQAENSVGKSHESYTFGGHQWALAIDAAS